MVPVQLFRHVKAEKETFQRLALKNDHFILWNCHKGMIWTLNKFPITPNSGKEKQQNGKEHIWALKELASSHGHSDLGQISLLSWTDVSFLHTERLDWIIGKTLFSSATSIRQQRLSSSLRPVSGTVMMLSKWFVMKMNE